MKPNSTFSIYSGIRPHVAIVLTVYGIETLINALRSLRSLGLVAIVLTVYGIETIYSNKLIRTVKVAIVLTVYGIETWERRLIRRRTPWLVAIVLTVYGIETSSICIYGS